MAIEVNMQASREMTLQEKLEQTKQALNALLKEQEAAKCDEVKAPEQTLYNLLCELLGVTNEVRERLGMGNCDMEEKPSLVGVYGDISQCRELTLVALRGLNEVVKNIVGFRQIIM